MKQHKGLLLGIDIGTTGTKCTFYYTDGTVAAHAYQEYPMICPEPGWAEQNPEVWWQAVCSSLKTCFAKQHVEAGQVLSIGLSCTNAVVLVDFNGKPVYNAIGLRDNRAGEQVEWLKEQVGDSYVREITANHIAGGSFTLPTLRWMIDHRPHLVERAYKFLMPDGYIIQRLTGQFTINRPRMSFTLLSDIKTGEWSDKLIERSQFPRRLLPEPFNPADIVGTVTKEAAAATGLAAGTKVTAGCLDTAAASCGSGAVSPGDFAITMGSSGRICYISEQPIYDSRFLNCPTALGGLYAVIQSTDNCGVSLRWFRDLFGKAVQDEAHEAGLSVYDYFNRLAEQSKAGAGGLLYLPYLSGEKSPIWNPDAKGVFFGLSIKSSYGDCVRAIMEGVAYSIRDCMNTVIHNSPPPELIPLGGGIGKSTIWCQIMADVLGCKILKLENSETETLGDMIVAAQSINLQEIPCDFGKKHASGTILIPDGSCRQIYEEGFRKYKSLYESLKPLF